MWRALLIGLFAVTLAHGVHAEEDPRDAERQFRFLLSRGDELRTQKDQFDPHTPLAAIERWKAQLKRLEGDYQHFLHNHPQHARAMVAYGDLLFDEKDEDEGVHWWEKAIAVDPREPYAYNDLANFYGHAGGAAKALQYYQTAIDLEPTEPIFRFNWATTCQLFRKESHAVYGWSVDEIFQHSLEQFRAARDLDPQNYDLSSTYAETFYQMPKPDWPGAYDAWQFCLRQPLNDSQRQFVWANLARVCTRVGRYDEAKEWASKLSGREQETVRRAIERKIAELSKANTAATATNIPETSIPSAGGKK
jgi:tetratricopeptide (TPR) repeat protein